MKLHDYKVQLFEFPVEKDWDEVRRRALVTMNKTKFSTPTTFEWKQKMLDCRHSPIRRLHFSFYMEIPSWVSVHFARHVHSQPYISSQRNDRQEEYDRDTAPQNAPVKMIFDVNAEELMTIMNKRLCMQASKETRYVVQLMRKEVLKYCPEFEGFLVPMCVYHGGVCHEMFPCKRGNENGQEE